MKYQIVHQTRYRYDGSVTVSHHLARLAPRTLPSQRCPWHELKILPVPVGRGLHIDAFGNTTTYFEIEGKHEALEVTARSFVEIVPVPLPAPAQTPPWEHIRDSCGGGAPVPGTDAGTFRFASPMIPVGPESAAFARPDFTPGRPVLDAVLALTARMFRSFRFDPRATDVSTPVEKVLKDKAGVCQDFAHLLISALRSLGLPARYVSGYLETVPPPGKPRLIGADASHAWISVFCGHAAGWIDVDPTNNIIPGDRHITVAWGRDYSDVSPLRGVTLGAGRQRLRVAVDVIPMPDGN